MKQGIHGLPMCRIHLFVGVVGLLIFALQGQYMSHYLNELQHVSDGKRMLYRSAHIYLMLSSILNVIFGLYVSQRATLWRTIESFVVLSAPIIMLLEFFFGASHVEQGRPFAFWSLVSIFVVFSVSVLIELKASFFDKNESHK